jgi:hypothetical protein
MPSNLDYAQNNGSCLGRVLGNEGMVDVHESDDAPVLLRRGQRLDQKGGHADTLWTEDFTDTAAGPTANPGLSIEVDQPGRRYARGRLRHVAQSL